MLVSLHHRFRPIHKTGFIASRTDCDLQHLILLLRWVVIADEAAVDLHLARIILRCHVAAAVPALVANTEHLDFVGIGVAVGAPFFGERCRLCGSHIFQPVGRFAGSARAHIHGYIRLAADLVDKVHELLRAESIWLNDTAPAGIEPGHSFRAYAVAPVILIGEAAAWPANVWHLERLQRGDHIVADAEGVRDRGVWTNPNSVVNAVAEMFSKLTEDIAVDFLAGLGRVEREFNFLPKCQRSSCSQSGQNYGDQHSRHDTGYAVVHEPR